MQCYTQFIASLRSVLDWLGVLLKGGIIGSLIQQFHLNSRFLESWISTTCGMDMAFYGSGDWLYD